MTITSAAVSVGLERIVSQLTACQCTLGHLQASAINGDVAVGSHVCALKGAISASPSANPA